MSLRFMDGFETVRNDADLRTHGFLYTTAGNTVVHPASVTGVAGTGAAQLGSAAAQTATPFAGGTGALGYFTKTPVNQAWLAGGFSFGLSAKSNSVSITRPILYPCANPVMWDGSKYWCSFVNGTTMTIGTSTDLKTWTPTATQPSAIAGMATVNGFSVVAFGNNVVALGYTSSTSSANIVIPYSTNGGATWSTYTAQTGTAGAYGVFPFATGNATNPHGIVSTFAGGAWVLQVGTFGGGWTTVLSGTASSGAYALPAGVAGGYIFVCASNGTVYSCPIGSASINSAGGWVSATGFPSGSIAADIRGIAYCPVSNTWVYTTSTGIYSIPNTGAAGTPVQPSGAQTPTTLYSTSGANGIYWTGTALVTSDNSYNTLSSANGTTFAINSSTLVPTTASTTWSPYYDSAHSQMVFVDNTNGLIATSGNGVTNYQLQYCSDKSVGALSTTSINGMLAFATTANVLTNPTGVTVPLTASQTGYVFTPGPMSGINATYNVTYMPTVGSGSGVSNAANSTAAGNVHYYELVYTSATVANTFNYALYIDGVQVFAGTNVVTMAAPSDVTSNIFINLLPSTQMASQIDDFYFSLLDGIGVQGPLGGCAIVADPPVTDVQDMWTKTGGTSNSLSSTQPALSSNTSLSVQSTNAGDKDVYRTTGAAVVPVGYNVRAVEVEAYVAKLTAPLPSVSLGVLSGSREADGATSVVNAVPAAPAFISQIFQTDPNTQSAWTNAAAEAAQLVLNHVG